MPNRGNREAIGEKKMKKLFAFFLLFLNILPTYAVLPPRDDRDSGTGLLGGLIVFVIIILWGIIELKNENNK